MKLSGKDYDIILNYYEIDTSGLNKNSIKEKAENILAEKLCRCIKKVDIGGKDESKAIAICSKSVLHKKGIKANKFECKKKARLIVNKKTKRALSKFNKYKKKNSTLKIQKK